MIVWIWSTGELHKTSGRRRVELAAAPERTSRADCEAYVWLRPLDEPHAQRVSRAVFERIRVEAPA